jgi:hypothetical protein
MYLSNEVIESVGKSIVFDFVYMKNACTSAWNWIIYTWSIQTWNPKWDITSKVWETNVWDTTWDTKRYDEAYCDLNFLDTDHFISHEKSTKLE